MRGKVAYPALCDRCGSRVWYDQAKDRHVGLACLACSDRCNKALYNAYVSELMYQDRERRNAAV